MKPETKKNKQEEQLKIKLRNLIVNGLTDKTDPHYIRGMLLSQVSYVEEYIRAYHTQKSTERAKEELFKNLKDKFGGLLP